MFKEQRFRALGKTQDDRLIHVTFTLRDDGKLIRVISGRNMLCIERMSYSEARKEASWLRYMTSSLCRACHIAKPGKKLPEFKSEAEERESWERHDLSDHLDWSQADAVRLPNLKGSTKTISLRLPVALLERIQVRGKQA